MNDAVLECQGLSKEFKQGPEQLQVLKAVDFQLLKGEFVSIIGNSGSGKTTLLHLLGGLDTPSSGKVLVNGNDFSALGDRQRGQIRNRHIGFVYQFHHLLPEFTALENVSMPLLMGSQSISTIKQEAQAMLARVGLEHRINHKPAELSGGERQRVAIARALVTKPACLLADEPTGNLDVHTAAAIQDLMYELNESFQTSFLVVTHDLSFMRRVDRVMKMTDGHLETSSVEEVGRK